MQESLTKTISLSLCCPCHPEVYQYWYQVLVPDNESAVQLEYLKQKVHLKSMHLTGEGCSFCVWFYEKVKKRKENVVNIMLPHTKSRTSNKIHVIPFIKANKNGTKMTLCFVSFWLALLKGNKKKKVPITLTLFLLPPTPVSTLNSNNGPSNYMGNILFLCTHRLNSPIFSAQDLLAIRKNSRWLLWMRLFKFYH